jgi:hypothetical protein
MAHKFILACLCIAAVALNSCDNNNPTGPDNDTDTTTDTSQNIHRNPANNPFIGTWVAIIDTAKDSTSEYSDSIRAIACGCDKLFAEYWTCPAPDTIIFTRDSITSDEWNPSPSPLYRTAAFYYSTDTLYYVSHAPCVAVGCNDSTDQIYPHTYKLNGDTLFLPYAPNQYNPFYLKVK